MWPRASRGLGISGFLERALLATICHRMKLELTEGGIIPIRVVLTFTHGVGAIQVCRIHVVAYLHLFAQANVT